MFKKLLTIAVLTLTFCQALTDDTRKEMIKKYDKNLIQNLKKASAADIKLVDFDFENAGKNVIVSCYIAWGGDITDDQILMTWASYRGGILDDNHAIYNHFAKCLRNKIQMLKTIGFQDWQIKSLQGAIKSIFISFDKDPDSAERAKENIEYTKDHNASRQAYEAFRKAHPDVDMEKLSWFYSELPVETQNMINSVTKNKLDSLPKEHSENIYRERLENIYNLYKSLKYVKLRARTDKMYDEIRRKAN